MQTLFAISILCFLGILWAAIALARQIKKTQMYAMPQSTPSHTEFRHHFLSAAAPVPTSSTIPHETSPETPHFVTPRVRANDLNQSVHEIAANKQWTLPPHPVRILRLPLRRVGRGQRAEPSIPTRKPPQPASSHGTVQRIDPAYFNKDLGDLTDPHPSRIRVNTRNRRG